MKKSRLLLATALVAASMLPNVCKAQTSPTAPPYLAGNTCSVPIGTTTDVTGTDIIACSNGVWVSLLHNSGVPSGAVEAFNLTSCPSGWVAAPALAGRTIIGAGGGNGLTVRNVGDNGGEEMHTMTIGDLVTHNIFFLFGASDKGGRGNGYAYSDNAGGSTVLAGYWKASQPVGGGQPFNVMMPYYTLLYCVKS